MSQTELTTALFRLLELAEWEIEAPACPDPPPGFHYALKEAAKVTKQFLSEIRPPAGDYFIAADRKRRPGRESQY